MKEQMFYLILVLYGGGIQDNPSMTTVPSPMKYEDCRFRGKDWADSMSVGKAHWRCIKVDQ